MAAVLPALPSAPLDALAVDQDHLLLIDGLVSRVVFVTHLIDGGVLVEWHRDDAPEGAARDGEIQVGEDAVLEAVRWADWNEARSTRPAPVVPANPWDLP